MRKFRKCEMRLEQLLREVGAVVDGKIAAASFAKVRESARFGPVGIRFHGELQSIVIRIDALDDQSAADVVKMVVKVWGSNGQQKSAPSLGSGQGVLF